MKKYLERIEKAQTLNELDTIVENAAYNELLTETEYCNIYAVALKKAQSF